MLDVRELPTYPTWARYKILSHTIQTLGVRERRDLFMLARTHGADPDAFFPQHGFTLGEFAVWHVIGNGRRQGRRK